MNDSDANDEVYASGCSSVKYTCVVDVVDFSLTPSCVNFDHNYTFCNVWAGNFGTIARTHQSEHIFVWGLNASQQLGPYCTATTHDLAGTSSRV